jgi:hypothetical protein
MAQRPEHGQSNDHDNEKPDQGWKRSRAPAAGNGIGSCALALLQNFG